MPFILETVDTSVHIDVSCLFPYTRLLLMYNRHVTVLPVSSSLCGLRSRGLEACLAMDTCACISIAAEVEKGVCVRLGNLS